MARSQIREVARSPDPLRRRDVALVILHIPGRRSGLPVSDVYSPVPELNLLMELQQRLGGEFISDGFELIEFGEPRHDGWSDAPEFLDGFLPFAYANSSGSLYAFWRMD